MADNKRLDSRFKLLVISLILLLFALIIFSFGTGRYSISLYEIFNSIYKKAMNVPIENNTVEAILFHVRLPRIVFSILVGAALSVAGACYQGLFKNPLVNSDVIGASSGAAFGAALAQDSKILIMDEPTSNLDFRNQIYLMSLLKELASDGYTIFISMHNPDFALRYADEVVVLDNERIKAKGKPMEVMTDELLTQIYQSQITVSSIENSNIKTCIAKVDL